MRGDKENTLHEVLSINRLSNRVFVKGATNKTVEGKVAHTKNYHYSRCQLFVGNYEFPSSDGLGKDVVPVFAQRVTATRPKWSPLGGHFVWNRYAAKTVPRIPWETGHIQIAWPKPEPPSLPEPTSYDTEKDVVAQVTYQAPRFQQAMNGRHPVPPPEAEFLRAYYNAGFKDVSDAQPVEVFLHKELSDPHSRAKQQARWKIRKSHEKTRLEEIVAEEMKHQQGRPEREIRAESAFRLRQELKQKELDKKKMRWKHRMADVNMIRRARNKVRKEDRQRRKLTDLVLAEEENQVIPKVM